MYSSILCYRLESLIRPCLGNLAWRSCQDETATSCRINGTQPGIIERRMQLPGQQLQGTDRRQTKESCSVTGVSRRYPSSSVGAAGAGHFGLDAPTWFRVWLAGSPLLIRTDEDGLDPQSRGWDGKIGLAFSFFYLLLPIHLSRSLVPLSYRQCILARLDRL